MAPIDARLAEVCVGRPRTVEWQGRAVTSSIWKEPVAGPVRVEGVNVAGDEQTDPRVHGGPDKAVYAYAEEDARWWADELARPELAQPGTFGENLRTVGVDVTGSCVGERWRIGTVVLEVCQPREPCFKLGMRVGDASFPDRFRAACRPGAYLRIVEPGTLAAGEAISIEPAAPPLLPVGAIVAPVPDLAVMAAALDDPRSPESLRRAAARALRHAG